MHIGSKGWPMWSNPTDKLLLLKLLKKLMPVLIQRYACALFSWGAHDARMHWGVIYVDVLTCTTYLSVVADHVHHFIEMVYTDGCGLFQQDNTRCHKAKMAQEWF